MHITKVCKLAVDYQVIMPSVGMQMEIEVWVPHLESVNDNEGRTFSIKLLHIKIT